MDVQVVASGATGQQQAPDPRSAAPAAPVQAAHIPGEPDPQGAGSNDALSSVVAKIFGNSGGSPSALTVNVSYRVERDPDMIVTVFTDPKTGKEIAQVPAEVMVQIAQFFDKESGVTLDRSA